MKDTADISSVRVFKVPAGKSPANGISVTVNGQETGVFSATVNNSRVWDKNLYSENPVAIFEFEGKASVCVNIRKKIRTVVIRPLSADVKTAILPDGKGCQIQFDLEKHGTYTVEADGNTENVLHLIANPVMRIPEGNVIKVCGGSILGGTPAPANLVLKANSGSISSTPFGTDRHADVVHVLSGQTLYIEGGSSVNARLLLESGSRVTGSGIVSPGGVRGDIPVEITDARDVSLEGITVVDAPIVVTRIKNSSKISLSHFHIISATPNSDGISIQSSHDVRVENCFVRSWDDGIVLKNYNRSRPCVYNVTVRDTVLWTDLAQCMEIGAETNRGEGKKACVHDIIFENIDVLHAMHKPVISIHNMDDAEVYNITYRNIRVEDARMGKNSGTGDGWPLLIDLTNVKGAEVPGTAKYWTAVAKRGSIKDVIIDNMTVLSWNNDNGDMKAFDETEGFWKIHAVPGIRLLNSQSGGSIGNILIRDLTVEGHKVTKDSLEAANSWIGGYGENPEYEVM